MISILGGSYFGNLDSLTMELKPLDRRQFVQSVSVLSAASLLGLFPQLRAEAQTVKRVGGSFLKTSLNAYSFDQLLKLHLKDSSQGMDLFALCDFAAREGFDAIDLTAYYFPEYPNVPTSASIYKLKRYVQDQGLAISGTGIRNDFTSADKNVRDDGVRIAKSWIEVAAQLGAPVIRVFADSQPPFKNWKESSGNASREQVQDWMVQSLKECASHAESHGVILGIQNHGDFITSSVEHLDLINKVNNPWCGAIVDTGRYLTADPYRDIAVMAPYAVNWQIKTHLGNKITSPKMDLVKLIQIIRKSGYRGYLPIETLSFGRTDYNPLEEVPVFFKELKETINKLSNV